MPDIGIRFKECRLAYEYIRANRYRSDLPCDISCAADLFDCGGGANVGADDSVCFCFDIFTDLIDCRKLSKRAKKVIIVSVIAIIFLLSYFFYGRGIAYVYVSDLGKSNQSLISRFTQRNEPVIRLLVEVGNHKIYSDIQQVDELGVEYKFVLNKTIKNFDIDALKVLDARLNLSNKIVVGQVLEEYKKPAKAGQGQRFKYRLKRRWHFW